MSRAENIITGLDIGTTKICAIIAEFDGDDYLNVLGYGIAPSRGMRKGVVVNIESTVESIKRAVEEAEIMANCEVESVFVGIAGGHIRGLNSHGIVPVRNREGTQIDIEKVIEAAKAVAMPPDREAIHVLTQEFVIDDQDGIKDPLGMSGVRLEGKVHIITCGSSPTQNIIKSVEKAGYDIQEIVLEPLASSEAVLTADEKHLGVTLIDFGGGTTDIVVYCDGSVKHTSVITVGGNHITNDIAIGLRTPTAEAEKIKKVFGCAFSQFVEDEDTVEVPSVGGFESRILSRKVLSEIIEPRAEEVFQLVKREVMKSGFSDRIVSGIVLTGGSTLMEGMTEIAEKVFELPVRKGIPAHIEGGRDALFNPMFSTPIGLCMYGRNYLTNGKHSKFGETTLLQKALSKMKSVFFEFF